MEQVFTPNLKAGATRGWCLAYVDDAGGVAGTLPPRTTTAKIAFNNEQRAGRIKTSTLPNNVWVVGWLDFTAGAYVAYGHVFFVRRSGNGYQLYDSEVAAGARQPYGSIEEMLAWFGAYRPKYIGWSTHCDGREYAKVKEEGMNRAQAEHYRNIMRVLNSEAKGWDREVTHRGEFDERELVHLMGRKDGIAGYSQQAWNEGAEYRKRKDAWKAAYDRLPAVEAEVASLKKQLEASNKAVASTNSDADKKLQSIKDALGIE